MMQWIKDRIWRLWYGMTEAEIDEAIDNLSNRRSVHTGALAKASKDDERREEGPK